MKRRRLNYDDSYAELYEKRARNDLHLKSRFEAIFEKYGRDFSDVGDEIDFQTGKVVVDKGHLKSMANEQDVGGGNNSSGQSVLEHAIANGRLSSSSVYGVTVPSSFSSSLESNTKSNPNSDIEMEEVVRSSSGQPEGLSRGHPQSLTSLKTPLRKLNIDSVLNRLNHRQVEVYDPPIEPAWQAPPLPIDNKTQAQRSSLTVKLDEERRRERSESPNTGSLWALQSGGRRPKNNGTPIQTSKPTSKLRRASMPSLSTSKDSSDSLKRKRLPSKPWTLEEEKLLRHLRSTTDMTFAQLEPYFPDRNAKSLHYRSQKLISGVSKHQQCWNNVSNIASSVMPSKVARVQSNILHRINLEDTDIDELQADGFDFRANEQLLQQEKHREPSSKVSSPRTERSTSPCPNNDVSFEDFMNGLQQHLEKPAVAIHGHSSARVSLESLNESSVPPQSPPQLESVSPKNSAPVPQPATAPSSVTPVTIRTKKKKYTYSSKATTALSSPSGPIDDLSEDELAPPNTAPQSRILAKVPPNTITPALSSRLQILQLDDGSEDELSTPIHQRVALGRCMAQASARKRRKSLIW
ncbi:hypothetical protein G7Y79_00017g043290 [Physcia stellaris]|nr:hypothetical protein G7Y79_00017g043290 [Physcia stellaris]